ncbi:MAG TPA: LuxR C-terminal-related transcriptional regulator [Nitrospira sp.]|nr:LuxR C-terminal-related transcriptional regulator [Nitrospira sp.]
MARHSTSANKTKANKTKANKHLGRTVRHTKSSLHITPRQREILRLVALGHTNREIAGSLDISVRTVEVHRFNLMRRLNVRNVAQLLRQALQQNLLPRNFVTK